MTTNSPEQLPQGNHHAEENPTGQIPAVQPTAAAEPAQPDQQAYAQQYTPYDQGQYQQYPYGAPQQQMPYPGMPVMAAPTPRKRAKFIGIFAGVAVLAAAVGAGAGALVSVNANGGSGTNAAVIQVASSTNGSTTSSFSAQTIAAKVLPSVVQLKLYTTDGQLAESGSGEIVTADGYIVTNNHVVADAVSQGYTIKVVFNDGKTVSATVKGQDTSKDLAVVKASGVSGLTPITFGNSSAAAVGQQVLAIGSPFGLQNTVTEGIISALNRSVSVQSESNSSQNQSQGYGYPFSSQSSNSATTTTTYTNMIQTDAAISSGNSGGGMFNAQGQLIGINSVIESASTSSSGSAGSNGLGFAIPSNTVQTVVQTLINS